MGLLTKNQKITLASSLLMCLLSQAAYAQNYSAGNGQALGTDSVAIGEGSYATATNGVATGSGAIATGENLDKAGFDTRREKVQELERQITAKRNEVSAAQNEISLTNTLIESTNRLISQIDARQATVAQLLAEKDRLNQQKTTAEQEKTALDNALTEANNKYNLIPKDSSGNSIYHDFDKVLSTLEWTKLNNTNGRDELATDLKNKVEGHFTDLAGTYTNEQYKKLIDGYVSRNATAKTTTEFLSRYFYENKKFSEDSIFSYIANGRNELEDPAVMRRLFRSESDIDIPTSLNISYELSWKFESLRNYNRDDARKTLISSMYFDLSAKHNPDAIANKVTTMYKGRYHTFMLTKLPPINKEISINSDIDLLTEYSHINLDVREFLFNNNSTREVEKFKENAKLLKNIYNSIDDNQKDSWWFDLDDYKTKVERIIRFNDAVEEYLDIEKELKVETAKPLAEKDQDKINQLSARLLTKKEFIDQEIDNKENYLRYIEVVYRPEILESEFQPVKHILEEMYNQTRDYIQTYDANNEIIQGTRQKAEELRDAVATATSEVESKQNEINRLIDQIANLGLTPDDETLARRKQEQEALLAQRQQELAQHQQERDAKQAELDKLNADLANSPLRNLGTNAMAEGNNAFASGANAIAYGANALATGNDSVAMGAGAQATEKNATAIGAGAKATEKNATAIGAGAKASAAGATALGQGAEAKGQNSIALGSGSVATKENEFSVGNATLKRNITNVKNGLIEDTSSEAVTGQQLKSAANILGATVTDDGLLSFEYSLDDNGTTTTVNDIKSALDIIVRNNNGTTGGQSKYVAVKSQGAAASAKGEESVAIGGNTIATGANSVAIGSGSVATSDNEFSVGNVEAGLTRRITNVAEGVADNDAVNMAQFRRLDKKLQKTEKRLSGGIAGAYAAAALINASGPGETMISAASGSFNKSVAVAVGYSRVSDNGKVSLKLLGSASNNGDVGGGIGIGYKF